MTLPLDSVMLLSVTNTNLRDRYTSFAEFCEAEQLNKEDIEKRLNSIDYYYDETVNQFR